MTSAGSKLLVIKNYPAILTINQIITILAYVVIGVFLVSSLAYRMIGVEILHSFLVIYFVFLETASKSEAYMVFTNLKPINLNLIEHSNEF